MNTQTRKVFAISAAILALGIGGTEMMRGQAQANPALVVGGAAGYAASRIDAAFEVVAAMLVSAPITIDVAQKGDLPPLGCVGPFRPEVQAECIDAAYEVAADEAFTVVETSTGEDSSMLMRMLGVSVAGF